nr:hypothetical protein [Mycolicibacter sinensis]
MTLDLMRLYDLTGRTAIVTGGTRGIGFAIAEAHRSSSKPCGHRR